MKRMGALLFLAAMLTSPSTFANVYCIHIKSHVSGIEKIHRCAWFNTFDECKKAAAKVDGVRKLK